MSRLRPEAGTRYLLRDDLAAEEPEAIANVCMAVRTGGSVERAAYLLGVPSRTLARWLAAFPALKKAVEAERKRR